MTGDTDTESADLFKSLRASTARMLSYDIDALSPLQALRLDMVVSLRLEIDRVQAGQLRGEAADLRALNVASETLENLLKPALTAAANQGREDEIATAELMRLLDGEIASREHAAAEMCVREELAAAAAAAMPVIASYKDAKLAPFQKSDPDAPPPDNTRTTYIDLDGPNEPLRPPPAPSVPVVNPLRTSSLNNPGSQPTPRKPTEVSPTYSAFADYEARRGNSFRRFDMPKDF